MDRAGQVRVLVVDDSVVTRRVVSRALERDPTVGHTDFAANGRIALMKIANRRPDVVVLDLEMPELDGFGVLAEIRVSYPDLPVIIFSSVDERAAAATLDALSLGATDFVVKPSGGSLDEAETYVGEHLAPLVRALAAPRRSAEPAVAARADRERGPVAVVGIGVSTGGPDALHTVVGALPATFPVPILVVQHMPPVFTRLLAERLDRASALIVSEAADGELVRAGHVYVAPGDRHLVVARDGDVVRVRLSDAPPENSCRPAADVLFRSLAETYPSGALGVVLTGMGRDGLRGAAAIRAAGGQVVVQDPSTAVIGSMPGSVAEAGLADAVLALPQLADELRARVSVRA